MTLNEYCEYIRNPLADEKARVVMLPPGETWTALRRFCQRRGCVELRLSNLVREGAWFPMPDEVFVRIRDAMKTRTKNENGLVLLGMSGYLSLLTDENKRTAIIALREWVDGGFGQEAVCFLRSDDDTRAILKDVFVNPRYRQGKQLIEISAEQAIPSTEEGRTEVTLVGDDLAPFIPESCDTFQKYLLHAEEHPNDRSLRRIVVASKGRELAGISAAVRQVVCLRDFMHIFYGVVDTELSEDALRWMCQRGKENAGKALPETLKMLFFPKGSVAKNVLHVFNERRGTEREVVLWLAKHVAPKDSYLEHVLQQENIVVENFISAYISGAAEWLDSMDMYVGERRDAIQEADVSRFGADIRQFIARCANESTSRVAPWLNCKTNAERTELLRRCKVDGVVSNSVKAVYPEVAAYLNITPVFGDETLEEYFSEYRELKLTGRVTPEFYKKAQQVVPPGLVQLRDEMVQRYAQDMKCALLVVDAMGVEWMPMLVELARQRNIGVDSMAVGSTHLPTSTAFNMIYWPDDERCLPDIKRFDNIAHKGVEAHETRHAEENLAAELGVIGGEVLPRVEEGLARFERVLVTADHGSSRLALLAWQIEPKLARTLACEVGTEIADWRYREQATQGSCPPEMEETLDGRYWVVRGYDRLPKKGGGQGFELHGGAALEERLVPVVVFSRTGQFVPKAKTSARQPQIIEKDDFDL